MNIYRVRQVIPGLKGKAKQLQRKWIIPPCLFNEVIPQGGYLPPLYRKMGPSAYGLFMEVVVSLAIQRLPLTNALFYLEEQYQPSFKVEDYSTLASVLVDHFPSSESVQVEPEWRYESLMGHPDLVGSSIIYDIKTTGRFSAMREETIFQLLAYYCLGQLLFPGRYRGIGLILPVTAQVVVILLEGWHWQPFWQVLENQIQELAPKVPTNPLEMVLFQSICFNYCGRHVGKGRLTSALAQSSQPLQFFVGGNLQANISQSSYRQLPQLARTVKEASNPVFIHAPYTLNPSNRTQRAGDGPVPWVLTKTQSFLEYGAQLGAQGVVIHCGKVAKLDPQMALNNMYETVCWLAPHVKPDCPLLIETSAGQKGELLSHPSDFIAFYQALPPEVQRMTQTCVDTCHVFAAGYEPLDFINQLKTAGLPIKLIHFNDSKHPKGAGRDRHAIPGQGYIGSQQLTQVLEWALEHRVPMVHE